MLVSLGRGWRRQHCGEGLSHAGLSLPHSPCRAAAQKVWRALSPPPRQTVSLLAVSPAVPGALGDQDPELEAYRGMSGQDIL